MRRDVIVRDQDFQVNTKKHVLCVQIGHKDMIGSGGVFDEIETNKNPHRNVVFIVSQNMIQGVRRSIIG